MMKSLIFVLYFISFSQQLKYMVHIMHHSHIDAGWMQDMPTLYAAYGRNILNSVTDALFANEDLKFNFADIIFLDKWW